MVKYVYDIISSSPAYGTDQTDVPAGSKIVQTAQNNLDIVEFEGTINFDLNNLDEFIFTDFNGNIVFQGTVRTNRDGDTGLVYGFDYGIELGEIKIRKNFENMTPLEIMEDVITNFTGLTWVAPTGVTDGPAIPLYPSQNKKAITIQDDMHKLLGTTHYMDVRNFNVEYEGADLNATTLTVGVNCTTDSKGWIQDTSQLAKNVTVNGGEYDATETTFLSGTGATQEFELPNPYLDITVEYPIGTELSPQLDDNTTGDYRVYQETKKIEFITITPISATDNIQVVYTYKTQANFNITEVTTTQILAGENPHHQIVNIEYLKETLECKTYAEKYKNKFKNPLRDVILLSDETDLTKFRANQRIRVVDNIHLVNGVNVNDEFIIKRIERGFGNNGYFLIFTVGDSRQFVFNKAEEVAQKVRDLNEKNPKAEVFNEGIPITTNNQMEVEFTTSVILKKATLPQNILVYDINRVYINGSSVDTGYKYISGPDFINLFEDVE